MTRWQPTRITTAAATDDPRLTADDFIGAFYGDFVFVVAVVTLLVQAFAVSGILKYFGARATAAPRGGDCGVRRRRLRRSSGWIRGGGVARGVRDGVGRCRCRDRRLLAQRPNRGIGRFEPHPRRGSERALESRCPYPTHAEVPLPAFLERRVAPREPGARCQRRGLSVRRTGLGDDRTRAGAPLGNSLRTPH